MFTARAELGDFVAYRRIVGGCPQTQESHLSLLVSVGVYIAGWLFLPFVII